jgi:hypothetical protein
MLLANYKIILFSLMPCGIHNFFCMHLIGLVTSLLTRNVCSDDVLMLIVYGILCVSPSVIIL